MLSDSYFPWSKQHGWASATWKTSCWLHRGLRKVQKILCFRTLHCRSREVNGTAVCVCVCVLQSLSVCPAFVLIKHTFEHWHITWAKAEFYIFYRIYVFYYNNMSSKWAMALRGKRVPRSLQLPPLLSPMLSCVGICMWWQSHFKKARGEGGNSYTPLICEPGEAMNTGSNPKYLWGKKGANRFQGDRLHLTH